MSDDVKQSWSTLGERMSALGSLLQTRFAAPGAEPTEPTEPTASGAPEGTTDQVRDALDQVVAATRELGERVGDVARDDEIRVSAKDAMTSLDDALRVTVDLIVGRVESFVAPADDAPTSPPEPSGSDSSAPDS